MTYEDYIALSSEIKELESLLAEIPEENAIDRLGLESRLESARALVADVATEDLIHKARLTFRGKPVFGSHGIAADFAAKAAGSFNDAVAAVAAGLSENLKYMGPIPDRQKNQLLITGTAIGSFGFEFELPKQADSILIPEQSKAEDALDKVLRLFELAAVGSDDDMAELVEEIHPRAVRKVANFLQEISDQEAWCGLEFKGRHFRFESKEQIGGSVQRLREDNIRESEQEYLGEFQGVLPASRNFEFCLADEDEILKGKVGSEIEDADTLNREYLHKPVLANLHVIQVGQGRPRFTLQQLSDISESQG